MTDEELVAALPPAPAAPEDLAERVLARVNPRPAATRWWLLDALAVLALAAVVVLAGGGRRLVGELGASVRTTVSLGARGVAVAEPGARLRYVVEGDARVEQAQGSVFYRVEPGGAFVVATPAGEVRVTGTCFRVEVSSMTTNRKMLAAGVAGAALSALVTVSVYEGHVVLAGSSGGRTEVAAGQRGRLESGRAPALEQPVAARAQAAAATPRPAGGAPSTPPAATSDDPVVLRARVADLETQVSSLRAQLGEAARGSDEAKRVSPTAEDLKAWAAKCEIHIDAPDVWGSTPSALTPERIAEWGLSADEAAVVDQAHAELHAMALAELRRIYVLATGDASGGGDLSPGALWGEIMDKSDAATQAEARRRLAAERAGLAAPPADVGARPPAEQVLRLTAGLGNDQERLVAAHLGAARAHELRQRYNGWPGLRMDTDGCPK